MIETANCTNKNQTNIAPSDLIHESGDHTHNHH
ncbi:hypothetical protein KYE_05661 [Marinobacter manganoxydans MnI7-9]|uniref:Uncharacterized protein n=1 Tax=Marinobacter manganoxydans MnI7-9 TaxID=1094979 RepID=G6YQL5_9GAMM|nr:hypothetical protein KYE_05661 [Marinobacter manganoxydans MnI7-9]